MDNSYKDWYLPFRRDQLTLRQARQDLATVSAAAQEIPLLVQLIENPKFSIPGLTIFHGAVNLDQHDNIHILLGRGLLAMDEAFTIGFTMGSTRRVSTAEESLYTLFAQHFYPKVYQMSRDDIDVFRHAVRLGHISACQPLDTVDFTPWLDRPLAELRQAIGLETNLLLAWYEIEKKRYPASVASQRLLDE